MTTNEAIILKTVYEAGLPPFMANLIVAQAKHESGNFSSPVYRDCNNAFGYSAYKGQGACPGHTFYKKYNNLKESTIELIEWLIRRQREGNFPGFNSVSSAGHYASLLKKNKYYEAPVSEYEGGLRKFYVDFSGDIPGSTNNSLLVMFALTVLIAVSVKHFV